MNISILETGKLPQYLEKKHGTYPAMFINLLKKIGIDNQIAIYQVTKKEFPPSPSGTDLWIITGSAHGVYDSLDWMPELKLLVRNIMKIKCPMLGICFGHQLMAEVMGGKVEKSDKGWGVGVHSYKKLEKVQWNQSLGESIMGYASHQDQVTKAPDSSQIIYGSEFCPNSVLAYGNTDAPYALSIQSHPEFTKVCISDIIKRRMGSSIPEGLGQDALKSLAKKIDNAFIFSALLKGLSIA